MNVSLPDALKAWAESRAQTGRYRNTSDYVRDLIRRDVDPSGEESGRCQVEGSRPGRRCSY